MKGENIHVGLFLIYQVKGHTREHWFVTLQTSNSRASNNISRVTS